MILYTHTAITGLGTRMMTEILGRARELGVHVVVGGLTYGNEASVKLMEKFGFTYSGTSTPMRTLDTSLLLVIA